jgi:hypothetical protein
LTLVLDPRRITRVVQREGLVDKLRTLALEGATSSPSPTTTASARRVFLTDQTDEDVPALDLTDRGHARA